MVSRVRDAARLHFWGYVLAIDHGDPAVPLLLRRSRGALHRYYGSEDGRVMFPSSWTTLYGLDCRGDNLRHARHRERLEGPALRLVTSGGSEENALQVCRKDGTATHCPGTARDLEWPQEERVESCRAVVRGRVETAAAFASLPAFMTRTGSYRGSGGVGGHASRRSALRRGGSKDAEKVIVGCCECAAAEHFVVRNVRLIWLVVGTLLVQ